MVLSSSSAWWVSKLSYREINGKEDHISEKLSREMWDQLKCDSSPFSFSNLSGLHLLDTYTQGHPILFSSFTPRDCQSSFDSSGLVNTPCTHAQAHCPHKLRSVQLALERCCGIRLPYKEPFIERTSQTLPPNVLMDRLPSSHCSAICLPCIW